MSTNPETLTPPAWQDRRVVWFQGFHDSLLAIENATGEKLSSEDRARLKAEARVRAEESGECYQSISLRDIFHFQPTAKAKMDGPAFVPSCYDNFDAREHSAQRDHGQFVALTGDIDKGDIDSAAVTKAVALFAPGAACLIFSSPHSRPGEKRWRVFLPLAEPANFYTWHDAQLAFYQFMEARGIAMDHALARAAQPVFLPNVPERHEKSDTDLRGPDGKPLFYKALRTPDTRPGLDLASGIVASGIAAIRAERLADEQKREAVRKAAEKRRAAAPRGDGASLIDDFNAANSVAMMLEICGYTQSTRNDADWKSPLQSGDTFATQIIGSKWVSLSQSDTDAGLGEKHDLGCYGDAYDLFVHYKHGGDHKSAYRQLGAEKRAAGGNVIYPAKFEAIPDWMSETPMPDEWPDWVQDAEAGEFFEEEFSPVSEPAPKGSKGSLPFEWAGQASPVIDGLWLIDDWLPATGIAAVYGHPGSGKSFLAIDMAAHIAAGVSWAGRHVEQGLVVYVVAEGQTGFRNRLYAMQQAGKIAPDAPFVFIPCPIDMQAPDGDLQALMETIHEVSDLAGMPLALLVIDTLSKTFGAGKENTDDMAGYVSNCQRVSSAFDCLTMVVHHRPKDSESRDMRGHSSLRGGIETTILVEAGEIKTATTLKQKDGEDNMVVRFKLDRVVIGEDKRGKEVSTCLTEIIEGAEPVVHADPRDARRGRLTGHKRMAMRAIEDVIAAVGSEPPADIPPDSIDRYRTWKAVKSGAIHDRLRGEFYALENGDEDKRRDNSRRNTNRVLKDLKSAQILGSWGDWLWLN